MRRDNYNNIKVTQSASINTFSSLIFLEYRIPQKQFVT